MLNNSEIQKSWEAEATQMGFFHADVWVSVELYDVLSYDGASSMDGLLSKDGCSDKYAEVYFKMYDNVQERQNLELSLLLELASDAGCDTDAVAQAYYDAFSDHMDEI